MMARTTIGPGPLPALDSLRIKELNLYANPTLLSAYSIVLKAEEQAVSQQKSLQNVVSARVTGCFLLEFHEQCGILGKTACSTLAQWVLSTPTNKGDSVHDVVYDLGTHLRDRFIQLFRTSNAPYQLPSSYPSRPSFDNLEDMIKHTMEVTGSDYRTSRCRALACDGFRCMITGILNKSSVKYCQALLDESRRDGIRVITVETAHILNESTMQGIDPEGSSQASAAMNKTRHAAGAMAMLESFGFSDFTTTFKKSGGIHQVWNLLSLQHDLHQNFDALELWFEHTEQPGCYKICLSNKVDEDAIRRLRHTRPHTDSDTMVVEFTSQIEQALPPDPRLLTLHATCARVALRSSAAEFFDKLKWDAEEQDVLASDGSSTLLLSYLISPFATPEATMPYMQTTA